MLNTAFPSWPSFTVEEADAVRDVLLSNKVNQWTGEHVKTFEREFASYVGTKHAVAVANGTLALELCFHAIDLQPTDEVIVTPRTFQATASSIIVAGGKPVFADVDRNTQALTAESIKQQLTSRTKAIVVVHLGGHPAELDPILALAKEHNLVVIEDCAQAHGAQYDNRSVGSFGHLAAWSFCQDKIMTTGGEGGMVTTQNDEYEERMWSYKDHGKSRAAMASGSGSAGFKWVHESIGTNWRMLEMQAVLGRIQLKRLDKWQQARSSHSEQIWAHCDNLPWIRVPNRVASHSRHGAYKAYVFIEPDQLPAGWTRETVLMKLNEKGIPVFSGSCSEVYNEKAYDDYQCRPAAPLPVAHELGKTSLMFLVHPTLEQEHIDATCAAITSLNTEIANLC